MMPPGQHFLESRGPQNEPQASATDGFADKRGNLMRLRTGNVSRSSSLTLPARFRIVDGWTIRGTYHYDFADRIGRAERNGSFGLGTDSLTCLLLGSDRDVSTPHCPEVLVDMAAFHRSSDRHE